MSLSWLREHRRAPSPVPRRQREVAMCETRRRKHVPMPVIALLLLALPAFIVPAGNRSSAFPSRNAPTATQPAHRQSSTESYGKLPLSFEANRGQTDPRVKFLSRGSGYALFLTGDEAVLALRSQKPGVRSQESGVRSQKGVLGHLSLVICKRQAHKGQRTKDKGPGTKDKGQMTSSE